MRRGPRTPLLGISGRVLVGLILAFIVLPAFVVSDDAAGNR